MPRSFENRESRCPEIVESCGDSTNPWEFLQEKLFALIVCFASKFRAVDQIGPGLQRGSAHVHDWALGTSATSGHEVQSV